MAVLAWIVTLVLIAILCILIYYWSIATYGYWSSRKVKTVPNETPLLGHLKDAIFMKKQVGIHFTDMYWSLDGERFGGYYKLRTPAIMIRDPAVIHDILTKDFASFPNNDVSGESDGKDQTRHPNESIEPMLEFNLFGMRDDRWKYTRSKVSPIFTTSKLRGMFPLMQEVCEELIAHIQRKIDSDNPEFKAKELAANFTTDVVASCAFALKANSLQDENNPFRNMGKEMMTPTKKRGLTIMMLVMAPKLLPLMIYVGLRVIPQHITDFFRKLVRDAFEYREKNNVTRNDLIQLLMQLKAKGTLEEEGEEEDKKSGDVKEGQEQPGKYEFTHDVLTAQAVMFFFDGYETTSGAIGYAMHELAVNPEIQTKLREELRKLVNDNDGVLTYDTVRDCPYLDQVVYETLRKHPIGGFMTKCCSKRYKIPGSNVYIEKGTPTCLPLLGIHYDPKYYPEPEKFIPERFSEENKKKRVPGTFLSFSDGPRQCIGMNFALAVVKIAIATVVLNFELQSTENTKEPVELDPKFFLNAPIGGLPIRAFPI